MHRWSSRNDCPRGRAVPRVTRNGWSATRSSKPAVSSGPAQPVLVRMDSAFFGGPAVQAVLPGGTEVSVTVR